LKDRIHILTSWIFFIIESIGY